MRPTISVAPPGGNTMTTRTGFAGYTCAHAAPHANTVRLANALNNRIVLMRFPPQVTVTGGDEPRNLLLRYACTACRGRPRHHLFFQEGRKLLAREASDFESDLVELRLDLGALQHGRDTPASATAIATRRFVF